MAKPSVIELPNRVKIPILFEDRGCLAVDKPKGWMLAPGSWAKTQRNLQLALESSIANRDPWAKTRNIRFIRFVHRLDADTSGVLLLAKNQNALKALSELFITRSVDKTYLAITDGEPTEEEWTCSEPIADIPKFKGKMMVDKQRGKDAETHFKALAAGAGHGIVLARPVTGRTHQIRLHLHASGLPILGDPVYAHDIPANKKPPRVKSRDVKLALRAVRLAYQDPFTGKDIRIEAPIDAWLKSFGVREKLTLGDW